MLPVPCIPIKRELKTKVNGTLNQSEPQTSNRQRLYVLPHTIEYATYRLIDT